MVIILLSTVALNMIYIYRDFL